MIRPANELLRQMVSSHLFGAPRGVPLFFAFCLCLLGLPFAAVADDTVVLRVTQSTFRAAHDGLIEAIESEGLVVGNVLPFRDMLTRTSRDVAGIPYGEAEIVQFCSSLLAADLVREAPEQLTLCPLSIALYNLKDDATEIRLAYRSPGSATAGRQRADALLQRIVKRAAELARLRW
ncbi:MAG: hypothetical protein H6R14_416 [Proteobacteria bacterium]|nr:hypothetical protein [Pseudomonadota bacterium]